MMFANVLSLVKSVFQDVNYDNTNNVHYLLTENISRLMKKAYLIQNAYHIRDLTHNQTFVNIMKCVVLPMNKNNITLT